MLRSLVLNYQHRCMAKTVLFDSHKDIAEIIFSEVET